MRAPFFAVAGEQRREHLRARIQRFEQRPDAGKHPLLHVNGGGRVLQRLDQPFEIAPPEAPKICAFNIDPRSRGALLENTFVGAAGHRDAIECAGDAEHILECPIHRATAGTARSNECSINIEQNNRH